MRKKDTERQIKRIGREAEKAPPAESLNMSRRFTLHASSAVLLFVFMFDTSTGTVTIHTLPLYNSSAQCGCACLSLVYPLCFDFRPHCPSPNWLFLSAFPTLWLQSQPTAPASPVWRWVTNCFGYTMLATVNPPPWPASNGTPVAMRISTPGPPPPGTQNLIL